MDFRDASWRRRDEEPVGERTLILPEEGLSRISRRREKSSVSGGSRRVGEIAVKSTKLGIWAGKLGAAAPHPSFPKVREETKVCPAVNPFEAKALRHSVAFITSSMTRQRA